MDLQLGFLNAVTGACSLMLIGAFYGRDNRFRAWQICSIPGEKSPVNYDLFHCGMLLFWMLFSLRWAIRIIRIPVKDIEFSGCHFVIP